MPTCRQCLKNIESKHAKVFCSRSCSAIYSNSNSAKRKLEGICARCGSNCSKSRKYCSRECARTGSARVIRAPSTANVIRHYRNRKAMGVEYLGGGCLVCGYNRSHRALHFHHIDSKTKEFTISGRTMSWSRMRAELDKCILLCAICHAEVHDELIDLGQYLKVVGREGLEPSTNGLTGSNQVSLIELSLDKS